jgi:hypothetical protein
MKWTGQELAKNVLNPIGCTRIGVGDSVSVAPDRRRNQRFDDVYSEII